MLLEMFLSLKYFFTKWMLLNPWREIAGKNWKFLNFQIGQEMPHSGKSKLQYCKDWTSISADPHCIVRDEPWKKSCNNQVEFHESLLRMRGTFKSTSQNLNFHSNMSEFNYWIYINEINWMSSVRIKSYLWIEFNDELRTVLGEEMI